MVRSPYSIIACYSFLRQMDKLFVVSIELIELKESICRIGECLVDVVSTFFSNDILL